MPDLFKLRVGAAPCRGTVHQHRAFRKKCEIIDVAGQQRLSSFYSHKALPTKYMFEYFATLLRVTSYTHETCLAGIVSKINAITCMKSEFLILSQKIKEMRQQRNLTREKLAFENDLSKPTITRIERNEFDPKLSTLLKIAQGLDIKISELLSCLD
jgi:DNA-binding XRE family transcriptional regulator